MTHAILRQQVPHSTPIGLAFWLVHKWQSRLSESGQDFQTVARQMRKQGYPLEIAVYVLLDPFWSPAHHPEQQ